VETYIVLISRQNLIASIITEHIDGTNLSGLNPSIKYTTQIEDKILVIHSDLRKSDIAVYSVYDFAKLTNMYKICTMDWFISFVYVK
jgi:hypothetical protein